MPRWVINIQQGVVDGIVEMCLEAEEFKSSRYYSVAPILPDGKYIPWLPK